MKYVVFIGSDGLPVPEALAVIQRELPAQRGPACLLPVSDEPRYKETGGVIVCEDCAAVVAIREAHTIRS